MTCPIVPLRPCTEGLGKALGWWTWVCECGVMRYRPAPDDLYAWRALLIRELLNRARDLAVRDESFAFDDWLDADYEQTKVIRDGRLARHLLERTGFYQ